MKLIAKVPILYGGRQYQPGDPLPAADVGMTKLWLQYRSAVWEADSAADDKARDRESERADAPPRRDAKKGKK